MKNNILFVFLFFVSYSFGQPIDSCDVYSEENILKAFNREVYPGEPIPDTFYLVHYFPVETEQGMIDYAKWVRQIGYQTLQEKDEYRIGDEIRHGYIIRMEKKFNFSSQEELEKEVKKLIAKRKELNLNQCNGSEVYSGYSIIQKHRFPKLVWGIDSCESYFKENIEQFYRNINRKNMATPNDLYINHSFEVPGEKSMIEFDKWAKANGYGTIQDKSEHIIGDNEISCTYELTLERKFDIKNLADLETEVNRVAAKRKELKAEKCYGTGMGIGTSCVERFLKYFKQ